MSERMTAKWLRDALKIALYFRGLPTGMSVRSDASVPGKKLGKRYSSVAKRITIKDADTAPMGVSAQRHLRKNWLPKDMPIAGGQE